LIRQQRVAFRLGETGMFSRGAPCQVVFEFVTRCVIDLKNDRGMDLPKRRQREAFRAKLTKEKVPVLPHAGLRFALRASQIEASGRTSANPPAASAKGMDQPGITGEERVFNPGQPAPRDEM